MKPIIEKQPPHLVTELVGREVFRGPDFACVWDQHPELETTLVREQVISRRSNHGMPRKTQALILAACLLVVPPATAVEIYVSPSGNDGNTGSGPDDSNALKTIQTAVNTLQPGDTLQK